MKINYNTIAENTGIMFENSNDLLLFIKNEIDYLFTHNKNYTSEQYNKIIDLKEIIDNIESEDL